MIVLRLIPLLVDIIIGILIFYDAHKKGRPIIGLFIAILAAITFPLGPLIYYFFIRQKLGQLHPGKSSFCPKCGFSSKRDYKTCPKCKNSLKVS